MLINLPDDNFSYSRDNKVLIVNDVISVPENIDHCHRNGKTFIDVDSYREAGFRFQDTQFNGCSLVDIEDFEIPHSQCDEAFNSENPAEVCFNCGWAEGIWQDGGCQYTTAC